IAPATARANRTTTNPRSGLQIRRMILLDVVLLTTLRLIPNEVLCFCRRLIHPSAWKGYSANFAFTEFSGVQVLFVLWGTYLFVGQEYAAFRCVASFVACNTQIGVGCSLYAPPLYSEEVDEDEHCREE